MVNILFAFCDPGISPIQFIFIFYMPLYIFVYLFVEYLKVRNSKYCSKKVLEQFSEKVICTF